MMARQFDTSKHSECYRPIPVHTPSSRRLPAAKQYINANSETATSPRYDQEYNDYKTTHYPSYPPNYPYDENNKYKYDHHHHHHHHHSHQQHHHHQQQQQQQQQQPQPQPQQQQQQQQQLQPQQHPQTIANQPQLTGPQVYGAYEKQSAYQTYEDGTYDSRSYMAQQQQQQQQQLSTTGVNYPPDGGEYTRYQNYDGGRGTGYPGSDAIDYTDKGRYGYGYERTYYENDGRYVPENNRHDVRYADVRHDARNTAVNDGRETTDRRYTTDSNREDEIRYDGRDTDSRYLDGRVDGRYVDSAGRYPQPKENYYDRYYKNRPSRDHHTSGNSRY